MRSIKHFIDNVVWYFNGLYTGVFVILALCVGIYLADEYNNKRKIEKK